MIVPLKQNYGKNFLQEISLDCDEKDVNLMNSLKNIIMKDVVFWAAGMFQIFLIFSSVFSLKFSLIVLNIPHN